MTRTEQKEMHNLREGHQRVLRQFIECQRTLGEFQQALANAGEQIRRLTADNEKLTVEHNMLFQALKDSHRSRKANEAQIAQMTSMANLGHAVATGVGALAQMAEQAAGDNDSDNGQQ